MPPATGHGRRRDEGQNNPAALLDAIWHTDYNHTHAASRGAQKPRGQETMMNFLTTTSPEKLRAAIDRFAAATGHKSVADVLSKTQLKGEIIQFQKRQPWWLND